MLSDKELDAFEEAIFNADLQRIPYLLGRALPMLFAELRLTREALNTQTEDFFRSIRDGSEIKQVHEVQATENPRGVPEEPITREVHEDVPGTGQGGSASVPELQAKPANKRAKRGRGRRKSKGDSQQVESRGSSEQVGRQAGPQGDAGLSERERHPPLEIQPRGNH